MINRYYQIIFALLMTVIVSISFAKTTKDPLPSWNNNPTKQKIIQFVNTVTNKNNDHYVTPQQRIAVFDNDGTLWPEKPLYFQMLFAIYQVKQFLKQHPQWAHRPPFKAVVNNDFKQLATMDKKYLYQLIAVTHTGMSASQFKKAVRSWIQTAKHPRFQRLYSELAYQPMLELIQYLRANQFKIYIVSGGDIDFMRSWVHKVYKIPENHVIGSHFKMQFVIRDNKPMIMRLPEMGMLNDKQNKPLSIHRSIGIRPIIAVGNSDGDLPMFQWVAAGPGKHLIVLIHHNDAKREWAYSKNTTSGHLDTALQAAKKQGWTIVNMKEDWKVVYPFELKKKP